MAEGLQYWDQIVGETRSLRAEDAYEIGATTVALAFSLFRDHTPKVVEYTAKGQMVAKLASGQLRMTRDEKYMTSYSVRRRDSDGVQDVTFKAFPEQEVTLIDAERMALAADTACRLVEEAYIGADQLIRATRAQQAERLGIAPLPSILRDI